MTRVMIVDDSLTVRMDLAAAFESAGFEAVLCASAGEARGALTANPIQVVILDVMLPDADGVELLHEIRSAAGSADVAILMLSTEAEVRDRVRALQTGADDYVGKPYDRSYVVAKARELVRSRRRKILAVDDSATYLNGLAETLRSDGYEVALARSGEEALELLAVESVDCVLLDLVMPGLGGQETCRRIKSAPAVRDIPLIMLTAREDRGSMLDGLAAGADDFLSKSSELSVLKARVRAQLRRKQFEDENRKIREQLLRSELEAAEARAAQELAETRAHLAVELERKNADLEAFSYSVSHDLRAPLRAIEGFTRALDEEHAAGLDEVGKGYVERILASAHRMSEMIEDLLELARASAAAIHRRPIELGEIARSVVAELRGRDPQRDVTVDVAPALPARGDARLLRTALENLLGNAWKFTAKCAAARIEVGILDRDGAPIFFVRDNGVGFAAERADELFRPFRRLHSSADFEGTGIGLATVHRIITGHGGRIWAESSVGAGATFYFTLP